MAVNYEKGLYNDYEKAINKLDAVLLELNSIRKEHKKEMAELKRELTKQFIKEKNEIKDNLNNKIDTLTKELKKSNELVKKLEEENERLRNQINKDSTNSSKPSSTNIVTPKRSGANLYNGRKKTNKKIGGQKGHKGHNLSKEKIEKIIKEKNIEVKPIYHQIKGNKKETKIKYRIGIKIKPYVEKHIFEYSETSKETMAKEFKTDVTYDESIKTLAIELGSYNLISYKRMSDFFEVISDGIITISQGTLINFLYEFSNKSEKTIERLTDKLLLSEYMGTDVTGTKYNKKNMYIRNYSTKEEVIYKAHERKNHESIKKDDILTKYLGGIIGDHDTALYSYGTKNCECNIHIGRYLEEIIQNVENIKWPREMKKLLFGLNEKRKELIGLGKSEFNQDTIEEIERQYDDILQEALKENQTISSTFYKEKANKLYRRLKKYKKNHLYFIYDFKIWFDNNISERDLRIVKNKTKISGGFRSKNGADAFVNALSIIKTSIKRGINPYESIQKVFRDELLFQ